MKFELKDAHPEVVPLIRDRFGLLIAKYPFVRLNLVSLYTPKSDDDRSMGYTTDDGEIYFNKYWFSKPIKELNLASHEATRVPIGPREMRWHGRMFLEPDHVCTHEFGHAMADSVPSWGAWADAGWRAATSNPENAVSAYGLANASEWSAEQFAAVELGCALRGQTDEFYRLLAESKLGHHPRGP